MDTKSHLQPSSYLQLLHVGKGKNFSFPAWVTQHIHHSLGQAVWPGGVVEKHKCTPCFSFMFEITIVSFSSFLPFFQAFLQIPSCWLSNSWSFCVCVNFRFDIFISYCFLLLVYLLLFYVVFLGCLGNLEAGCEDKQVEGIWEELGAGKEYNSNTLYEK